MNARLRAGLALLVMALALGFMTSASWLAWLDAPVMRAVALTATSPGWLVTCARFVSSLGDPDIRSVLVVLVCVVFIARHCWRSAALYFAIVALSIGSYSLAKIAYARPRPRLTPWLDQVADLSYPSGHAAGAMVILLTAALLVRDRWLRWPALILALAIGATRPMLGVHWPTDVLGGALWGAGCALIGAGVAVRLGLPSVRVMPSSAP